MSWVAVFLGNKANIVNNSQYFIDYTIIIDFTYGEMKFPVIILEFCAETDVMLINLVTLSIKFNVFYCSDCLEHSFNNDVTYLLYTVFTHTVHCMKDL